MPSHDLAPFLQYTHLQCPPLLPELQLHLADDIMSIWRMAEHVTGNSGVAPPYWAFAWVGGQAVARYVLDHHEETAGKRVLDVGSGSGICAIAAMRAGAICALATDTDGFAGTAISFNSQANSVLVDFTDRDLLESVAPDTDVILAGDICYEGPLAARVIPWLKAAHERGIRVLIGDPGREHFRSSGLVRLAGYHVPTTREVEDREVKRAAVYTFPA